MKNKNRDKIKYLLKAYNQKKISIDEFKSLLDAATDCGQHNQRKYGSGHYLSEQFLDYFSYHNIQSFEYSKPWHKHVILFAADSYSQDDIVDLMWRKFKFNVTQPTVSNIISNYKNTIRDEHLFDQEFWQQEIIDCDRFSSMDFDFEYSY